MVNNLPVSSTYIISAHDNGSDYVIDLETENLTSCLIIPVVRLFVSVGTLD